MINLSLLLPVAASQMTSSRDSGKERKRAVFHQGHHIETGIGIDQPRRL